MSGKLPRQSNGIGPSEAKRWRVFFALWPDPFARGAMSDMAQSLATATRGRATAGDRLHLTLAFMGHVPRPQIDTLMGIGAEAAARNAPFVVTLDRVGTFRRSTIVWLGARQTPPDLDRLVMNLREAIGAARVDYDRKPFQAHVTLVRGAKCPFPAVTTPVAWRIGALTLIASRLTDTGPAYTELAAWPLGPAGHGQK